MLRVFLALTAVAACVPGHAAPDVDHFDGARAHKHLEAQVALGPRPTGSEALEKLRAYLEKELSSYGTKPVRETFVCKEAPGKPLEVTNLYVDIAAPSVDPKTAPIVVLCTHFDTKRFDFPFVGANDGGSGTAVLLELARNLSSSPSTHVVWRLLFLDGEEALRSFWEDPDNRYGSRHHVEALQKRGEASRVKACVLLDMIGDQDLKIFRDGYSSSSLRAVFDEAASSIGLGAVLAGPSLPIEDDHLSFMSADIPSIDLIDFDYGPDNSYWHTAKDTLEHCSEASLTSVGRIVLAALPALERFATR